jgi:alpha-L-fucosidase
MTSILPSPAKKAWMELGYGMFIHFGPTTFTDSGWGDGRFPAENFNPKLIAPAQWADVAVAAGMKYAVLTTKHHDGYCLWPSEYTEYSVKNSPMSHDIVRLFVDAFRSAGIRVGLYYSLWDRNYPQYDDDKIYAAYMRNQMTELLTQYGDILEIWFDGGWDKDHPTREWAFNPEWENDPKSGLCHGERWEWVELYNHIHSLQPDCLVVKNSSSDWPGALRYHPVDIRTSEHFDFVYEEKVCKPIIDPIFTLPDNSKTYLPLEFCTSLNPHWFWIEGSAYSHPSAETICKWHQTARQNGANFLLNIGPNKDGLIPDYHREYLEKAARLMED